MSRQQWSDPLAALDRLHDWATTRAVETITWYLRDKRAKRWASRLLRAAAVVLAVTGGLVPLIASPTSGINPNLGYVFLASAAGCVAFDHFFGLSSGWMRDIATLQALQGRLTRFHLTWTIWQAGAGEVQAGIDLIEALVNDVVSLTEAETAQWITDFNNSMASLRGQASPGITSTHDLVAWSQEGRLSPK